MLILFFLLVSPGFAGLADFVNGVKLGRELPAHAFAYLGEVPRTEGKVRLIDFWATGCNPCIESMPELAKIHEQFALRGLAVVSVSREARPVVEAFLKKQPLTHPVAIDADAKLHQALRIKALPYAIIVDRSNRIIWRGQPGELTPQLIEKFLGLTPKGIPRT